MYLSAQESLLSKNRSSTQRLFKPSGFHNLPICLLIRIFKYFDEKELRSAIIPVCRQWRHAALSPQLWSKFKAIGRNIPPDFICQQIGHFSNLTNIYIKNVHEATRIIRQICRCCPNLKYLTIRQCNHVPEEALRNIICCCKNLESLDLSGTSFKGRRFFEEIAGLKRMKSLNLSKNEYLQPKHLLAIAFNCRNLEELRISKFLSRKSDNRLSDNDAFTIFSNLNKSLTSLSLDAATLTNFGFQCILKCRKLEYIGLSGTEQFPADLFVNLYKYLPNLRKIKIRQGYQIGGSHVKNLFTDGENHLKGVTSIDFTGCWKLTDEGIVAIANCCKNLKVLGLKSCKTITNLRPIRDNCTKLEYLNLAFCSHLDENSFLPAPKSLETLVLDETDKCAMIAKSIIETHKDIKVKIALSEYNKLLKNYHS